MVRSTYEKVRNTGFLFVVVPALTVLFCLQGGRTMADNPAGEYHVKAVFLYNLAKFVAWPESRHSRRQMFTIGIFGDDPFNGIIEQAVAGEYYHNKPIKVVRYSSGTDIASGVCDILFVGSSAINDFADLAKGMEDHPMLTVADTEGFLQKGGMVNLIKKEQRIEVIINLKAVSKAGLFISSKLLRLATVVE